MENAPAYARQQAAAAASIWPRRQRRGERRSEQRSVQNGVLLQFGHDVSVVENLGRTFVRGVNLALQFGHDVSVVEN